MAALLVDLDRGVDLADEEESRVEADGAGEQPEGHDHHEGVGEVQKGRNELFDVQLGVEVEDAVGEHVDGRAAGHQEGPPPPVVVLRAELEVDHDDADLGAGDHQDDEDQKEEPEQVVELVFVDGGEDEEELDEASAEGQDPGHEGAQGRVHVPDLLGNLPRNLVGSHRLLIGLLPVAEVVPDVNEGQRDAEPHGSHRQHGGEGDGSGRVLAPDEEVDEDPERENDAGVEGGGQECGPLPLLALQGLVESSGVVAADQAHELVEEDGGREEGTTRGRRQHPQHREEDGDGEHAEHLKLNEETLYFFQTLACAGYISEVKIP